MNRKADPNHLTRLPDGRYCKRVRGQLHYFGRDHDAALRLWLSVKDELQAGKIVPITVSSQQIVTVKYVRDYFLTASAAKVDSQSLRGGTFDDYKRATDEFANSVGKGRDPEDLRPEDFGAIRATWAQRMGPWSLDRYVQAVRTMFNYAAEERLIDRTPFYGHSFSKSTASEKRSNTRARTEKRGERCFTGDEVADLLAKAKCPLRAMVLLALNGGMYATDIASLKVGEIKQKDGVWVIDRDRRKTGGVPWEFPLWPETRSALDTVLAEREARRKRWFERGQAFPRDASHAALLFITSHGRPWCRETLVRKEAKIESSSEQDAVNQELDKILLASKRDGVGFGSLRHTHVTAVGDHGDLMAARRVRGHLHRGIETHYDKVSVARLQAVTDLARRRLITRSPEPSSGGAAGVAAAGPAVAVAG